MPYHLAMAPGIRKAVDETRTRDLHLGKVALYQLSYYRIRKWRGAESNHRHGDFQSPALPTELPSHKAIRKGLEPSTSSVTGWHSKPTELPDHISGNNRARTCDPLLVRQMLSQLSYAPSGSYLFCRRFIDDFDIILHFMAFVNTFWKTSSVNCMLRIIS